MALDDSSIAILGGEIPVEKCAGTITPAPARSGTKQLMSSIALLHGRAQKANLIKKLTLRHFAHLHTKINIILFNYQKRAPIFKCVILRRCASLKNHHRLQRVAVFSSTLRGTFLTSKRYFEMRLTVKSYAFGL